MSAGLAPSEGEIVISWFKRIDKKKSKELRLAEARLLNEQHTVLADRLFDQIGRATCDLEHHRQLQNHYARRIAEIQREQ